MSLYKTKLLVLLLFLFSFFSQKSLACDEDYISSMNEIIEEKKLETGNVISKMPNSVIIAQAIQETGYGTSRASVKKNNHFGLMSKGKTISFGSVEESVIFYLRNLDSNGAYKKLREKLQKGETNTYKILNSFSKCYAQDENYSKKILSIINQCNLRRYD